MLRYNLFYYYVKTSTNITWYIDESFTVFNFKKTRHFIRLNVPFAHYTSVRSSYAAELR